ncbi:MAG: IS200/IS605 family transposase [Fuerstiella sp.]|nr:IS200/IS605 family transposase [Fuerstiella sp.]MCP4854235.1 IS200/IS605 family transposase [Fuerstiella sp.]
MSSFTKLSYHIVFATKYRKPTIPESIQESLYEYIGGIIRSRHGALVQIGGVADHVHILARLSASVTVSDVVRDVKAGSSKWIYDLDTQSPWDGWQKGYGAFTVSYPQTEAVRKYIQNQAEHHRQKTFQEEFADFLTRHAIEYDPRFLFEDEHQG